LLNPFELPFVFLLLKLFVSRFHWPIHLLLLQPIHFRFHWRFYNLFDQLFSLLFVQQLFWLSVMLSGQKFASPNAEVT